MRHRVVGCSRGGRAAPGRIAGTGRSFRRRPRTEPSSADPKEVHKLDVGSSALAEKYDKAKWSCSG